MKPSKNSYPSGDEEKYFAMNDTHTKNGDVLPRENRLSCHPAWTPSNISRFVSAIVKQLKENDYIYAIVNAWDEDNVTKD